MLLNSPGDSSGTSPAAWDIFWGRGLAYVNIDNIDATSTAASPVSTLTGTGPVSPSFGTFTNGTGNEMQRISQTGNGAFALAFGGFTPTTAPIANPTPAQVQTYLNTITNAGGFQGVPSNITSLSGNTTVFGRENGGPYYVVFNRGLAFTDVPRFFAKPAIGTTMSLWMLRASTMRGIPEGPSIALTYTPLGGAGQQTRPVGYAGRNTPPTAQSVQDVR